VINTHGHWDHCSGNQLFPDSIIIGQENCVEYIRQNPANAITTLWSVRKHVQELAEQLDTMQVDSPERGKLLSEVSARRLVLDDLENSYHPTPPAKTFRDSLNLDMKDLTIHLIHVGNAHTNHDLLVYIPDEKTVISGDLFSTKSYFGFRVNQLTDVERMLFAIDRILNDEVGVERIITSHTEILSGEDLLTIRNLIKERYDPYKDRNSAAKLIDTLLSKSGITEAFEKYRERLNDAEKEYYLLEPEFAVLGRRLMGEGRLEEALAVFEIQVESFPESALAYDNLGETYLKMGNMIMATQNYEKSLKILPYNRNAEEILKIIRKDNF
jgi:glyoxylase-like metal-dependent hydrolase (beta-lactamase superfamily II)